MFRSRLHLARLLFHPLVQLRFLEAPAVAQLECGNLLFAYVLVERVRTHSQILRSLTNIHHFSRVGHVPFALSPEPSPCRLLRPAFTRPSMLVRGVSVSRAYISPEKPQVRANLRVLLGFMPVFWNWLKIDQEGKSICCGVCFAVPN